jgi:hypothetical protein
VAQADYRSALAAAIDEYESLGAERRRLDDRLAQLAQTIGTLSRLLGLEPTVPLGLTDACRLVLRGGLPMTPVDVRDRLQSIGVDLSVYTNELAAIHTILKRLNEAGEIRIVPQSSGKPAYLWQRPARAANLSPAVAEFVRTRDHESGSRDSGPGTKDRPDAARKTRDRGRRR